MPKMELGLVKSIPKLGAMRSVADGDRSSSEEYSRNLDTFTCTCFKIEICREKRPRKAPGLPGPFCKGPLYVSVCLLATAVLAGKVGAVLHGHAAEHLVSEAGSSPVSPLNRYAGT